MKIEEPQLRESFLSGLRKGKRSFLWVLQILLPVSFLTALLEWSGWIYKIDFLFRPMMSWLDLPPVAALPLLVGIIAGMYGGIAAMAALPFTHDQMTLMAIFMMICHSLVQEGIIQGKSGLHPIKGTLSRLGAAVITVIIAGLFLDSTPTAPLTENVLFSSQPFGNFLQNWFLSTFSLTVKIFAIIMSLLIFLEILKSQGWIHPIVKLFSPLLWVFGQSHRTGALWMTGAFFGLIYGSAVIVEEIKEGHLTGEEVERLHLSIGINHSFIEDPILFMALGLNFFWLWVPRLLAAIFVVHFFRFWGLVSRSLFGGNPPRPKMEE